MKRKPLPLERFAAKLLFQFRVVTNGSTGKRRTCEERIVVIKATHAEAALAKARKYGKAERHVYKNNLGGTVHFEFVGVLDLLHLGGECDDDEVWYDITEMVRPMERRRRIVPPEHKLNAIAWLRRATQQRAPAGRASRRSARR
jgi:hypothetical protein